MSRALLATMRCTTVLNYPTQEEAQAQNYRPWHHAQTKRSKVITLRRKQE